MEEIKTGNEGEDNSYEEVDFEIQRTEVAMKNHRLLWLSVALGAVFWLSDAAFDVWLFDDRSFVDEVFTSEPEEVRLRLVVWGLLIVTGYYGQRLVTALQAARDELEQRVQERTRELEAVNVTLRDEIVERKQTATALKTMSRKVQASQEEERKRIARELHDEIGQTLTMIKMNLQLLQRSLPASEADSHWSESLALTDQTLQKVRDVSLDLHPSMLDDLGLVSALRWYSDRHAQRSDITLSFQADGMQDVSIPSEVATACFRIVQEALTNVARHAHAQQVQIDLYTHTDNLYCSIKDDGTGFNVKSASEAATHGHSIGVLSMKERAELTGGGLSIDSAPGKGTEVCAYFPL